MAFSSGFDGNGDGEMSEINMIPLVDIMLVLLIIFIITVPVVTHTVKLDLPQASNQKSEIKPKTVTIAVMADGGVYWDQERVSSARLTRYLEAAAAQKPQPELHIRGDRSAEYEYVIKVMAAAQRSGIEKLGFITAPEE